MRSRFDQVYRFSVRSAVVILILSMVASRVEAAGTTQDFSAIFPDDTVIPGDVTVVLVDLTTGLTVVPFLAEPVVGLTDYAGRHGFDARTGGAFADQDMNSLVSSYTLDGAEIAVSYPIDPVPPEVHNQTWTPSLVDDSDWLRVATDSVGSQQNNVSWDEAYSGGYDTASHNFNIRISEGNPLSNDKADGFGWKYINSAEHGASGAFYTAGEEPNLTGSLGVGFDIWANGAQDNNANTSISLHYGSLIKTVNLMDPDNEPTVDVAFPLETGAAINVTVIVNPGDVSPSPILKGGTGYAVSNRGGTPSQLVQQGEGMDAFLRITEEAGSQANIVAFDHTMDGAEINASFKFRGLTTEGSNRADGMSFLLVPTDLYGDTGADQIPNFDPPGVAEEPNLAGAFGVGFDTFNNDTAAQDDPEGMANIGNHISTHFDGVKLTQVDYDLLDFDLVTSDPNVWHQAEVSIQPGDGGSNVTVLITDGTDNSEHLAYADFIPGMNLDSVRAVFAARTGGAFDNYDIDDVLIEFPGTGPPCDFDSDGLCNTVDIDLLGKVIIAGTNDPSFDVNGDSVVTLADQDQWRADAAAENGFSEPYLNGDANLDGSVLVGDLNAVGTNWQGSPDPWSSGDFNADGIVNVSDLNLLALNWQDSIPMAAAGEAVPEPSSLVLLAIVGIALALRRRQ